MLGGRRGRLSWHQPGELRELTRRWRDLIREGGGGLKKIDLEMFGVKGGGEIRGRRSSRTKYSRDTRQYSEATAIETFWRLISILGLENIPCIFLGLFLEFVHFSLTSLKKKCEGTGNGQKNFMGEGVKGGKGTTPIKLKVKSVEKLEKQELQGTTRTNFQACEERGKYHIAPPIPSRLTPSPLDFGPLPKKEN